MNKQIVIPDNWIPIREANLSETPSFEIMTEDGPGSTWRISMAAIAEDGKEWTARQTFDMYDKDLAEFALAPTKVIGAIDPEAWNQGSPWDDYGPQTYEEEKAEALERESQLGGGGGFW
jgi:hypothetical protein